MASGFFGTLANAVQGGYHQVNPFDNGRTYATNAAAAAKYDNPAPKKTSGGGGAATSPGYDVNAAIAAANKSAQDANALYASIAAQQAAMPRLPVYNTSAAWATAQKQATQAVDPVYTDKLNQYLQQEKLGTDIATRKSNEAIQDIETGLNNQLTDNATTRTRTGEDETTRIGDVGQNETNYQQNTGTAFDRARAALLGGVANAGLTTSGLGAQQEANAISDRNSSEKQQTQTFENTRRDIHTAATRTFEDLSTSDTRATAGATTGKARTKQELQDYIDNAGLQEQAFRTSNEGERQAAIAGATTSAYKQGVQQFIASLIGSGARAQDIGLAAQVYGA